ncbi:hypothetical protein OSB04_012078 [Centaurea solstitialis]|uniref:CCHC-type domain-containing protein n=1 Tax=Centaurea solstitialis TaxID=347529 RepID=A0AA38WPQ4_9ASTR|nr:hypothetical protein OSB04_012078 [Centaurea solstitialis]
MSSEIVTPHVNTTVGIVTPPVMITAATTVTTTQLPNTMAKHAEKPEKFSGLNFRRWQQKMFFYLTTLNLAQFLTEVPPQVGEGESDVQSVSAIEAWKHSEVLCRNYVLNGLADPLYNVYCKVPTAKELWESLDRKYKTEDARTKKQVVARFLEMTVSETFQVAAMIEKLPPGWIDFKNYLKHKRKEMSVEELVVRLRIEEDNCKALKGGYNAKSSKVNVVKEGQSSKAKGKRIDKGKAKANGLGPKKGTFKKKFKCYNCGQAGHKAADCKQPKKETPRQVNMMDEELVAMITDFSSMMISEVNMIGANAKEWWVDTGATRNVCYDKDGFHTFKEVNNDQKLFMGNAATAEIKGVGEVVLRMTSGKELELKDVLFVPELRKNLVSGWLLNKVGFKLVFESDKFVLSKGGMYVGKGYAMNGMFKLNVMVVNVMNKNASTSAYMLEFSNIWHGRLGHVNFHSIQRLTKVVVPPPKVQNLGPKTMDCIFIGYAQNSSAHWFLMYESKNPEIHKNTIMESRNASYFENVFPCLNKEEQVSSSKGKEVVREDEQTISEEDEEQPRRSKRARVEKSFGPDFLTYMVESEPKTYREVVTSSEGLQWKEAIKSEIYSILQNHTWELVDLPPGCKPLNYRWIFKKKMKADGTIDKYKARPDLAYAVSRLSRYTSNPSVEHWRSITRLLRYLRYAREYGLHYGKYLAIIEGYGDANWISDIKDSRSTSGYVFTLGGAAISWKSSKKTVIARSTMESEFIALDKSGEEAEWIRQFVEDIPKWPKPVTTICIHCDSQSAIDRAQSTMYNGKSRHIRRRHNTIRQLLSTRVILIDYVKSKDNIADPLTKGLSRDLLYKSSKGMGLNPLNE